MKNKDKVFPNYSVDNIAGVEVVENQSKRKRPLEDKVQRKKTYAEILKTDRNKDDKLEQNRNKWAVDIVANKGCLGWTFKSMRAMLQTIMYKERDWKLQNWR